MEKPQHRPAHIQRLPVPTIRRHDRAMPHSLYIRETYIREVKTARAVAREYFERFPKDQYETAVESWRHLQCDNYEFTMKRLREPKGV
jgi:hypothetical protein